MSDQSSLTLDDFIKEASTNTALLKSFLRDPERMATRFNIDRQTLSNLKSAQGLLEAVATHQPQRLALVAAGIFGKQSALAFGDFRDSPDYKDHFRDGASDGNFVDRHDNST